MQKYEEIKQYSEEQFRGYKRKNPIFPKVVESK